MRRTVTAVLAAAMATTTLTVTAPARAADGPPWPITCLDDGPSTPPRQSVYFDESGRLIVNPEAAPDDAVALAWWAPDWVLAVYPCLAQPLPTDSATCMYQKLLEIANSVDPLATNARYVYPNPNGPGYAVDYQLLVADAAALVACNLTTIDGP